MSRAVLAGRAAKNLALILVLWFAALCLLPGCVHVLAYQRWQQSTTGTPEGLPRR